MLQAGHPAAYPTGGYPPATGGGVQQQLPPPGEAPGAVDVEAQQTQQQQFVEDDADCICCGVPCTIL